MKRSARTMLQLSLALALVALTTSVAAARPVAMTSCTSAACGSALPEVLVGAGDDLVWSANEAAAAPPWPGSTINAGELWQMKKSGPSNSQRQLYREERATQVAFGSVLVVTLAGVPYVYFVANYDGYITYIKRIPLAGGAATIVSRTSFMGLRDLKSDGAFLYWADVDGVRRMPVGGGAITTLFRTTSATQLDLDASYLYFNAGTNGASLHRVPKAGGAVSLQVSTESRVTDLVIHASGAQTTMYWSEDNASVRSRVVGSTQTELQQPAVENRTATSLAFDGSRLLWIECTPNAPASCPLRQRRDGVTLTLFGNDLGEPNQSAKNLVADAGQVFWSDYAFLFKYVHTAAPTVVFDPAFITAQREGRGIVSATGRLVVSGGDAPFRYGWKSSNGGVRVPYYSQGPSATISATLAACDSYGADLTVTLTDAIGRTALAFGEVFFSATRPRNGVCD